MKKVILFLAAFGFLYSVYFWLILIGISKKSVYLNNYASKMGDTGTGSAILSGRISASPARLAQESRPSPP